MSFQAEVHRFLAEHGLRHRPETHALDLMAEVGEIAKALLEASRYGRTKATTTKALFGELGDAYFSLIALADRMDVDLEAALRAALVKYEVRLRDKGHCGSGQASQRSRQPGGVTKIDGE
jgi:NTP pyrophosphatase (non-canonical NTP hydrolase)